MNIINYRGKNYRVQSVKGWQHIIVTTDGKRQRIGISSIPPVNDYVFDYIFKGGFKTHPCPAMQYWIYRHRMGIKISIKDFMHKFGVKKKNKP